MSKASLALHTTLNRLRAVHALAAYGACMARIAHRGLARNAERLWDDPGPKHEALVDVRTRRLAPEAYVVSIEGIVDISASERLGETFDDLAREERRSVVVDLARTRLADSSILGTLLHARGQLALRGGSLRLVGVSGSIRRLLRVTGLERAFVTDSGSSLGTSE